MPDFDYWEECIAEAFEDAGITATKEQIETVGSWVEGAHDNFSQAMGHDVIGNPLATEIENLKREHQREIEAIQSEARESDKEWREALQAERIRNQRRIRDMEERCHAS